MALTAMLAGFVAGLFGIGGGLITVPFLYYIFNILDINQQYLMHLSVGTSFAIIIPTSIASVLKHHKFKAVDFNIVKSYGIFVILGVIVGTIFSGSLTDDILRLLLISVLFKSTTISSGIFSAGHFNSTFLLTTFNTPPFFNPGDLS